MSCALKAVDAVTLGLPVAAAHTPAITSASARLVTMAADYVTSATVRTPSVAMVMPVTVARWYSVA